MRKKIRLVLLVCIVSILITTGYFKFLTPKMQAGLKTVSIQIIIKDKGVNKTFQYKTDRAYVIELLTDKQAELKLETQDGPYGKFVTGLMGIKADSKKEFFNIKVDGKDATVGVSQLPIENKRTYTFILTGL